MSKSKSRRLSFNAAYAEAVRTGAFEAVETAPVAVAEKPAPKVKTPRWTPLDAERTAWIARNARPAISNCLCGCGETTKGRFFPGHDATLKESLKVTAAAGDVNASDALTAFGW
jgi:hypothetical protein